MKQRVLLAMSGGVDSSTAAVLLQREGFEVVGCTMQLWDYRRNPPRDGQPQFGRCCSLDDVYDARRVAEKLHFPFYVLNLEEQFERRVVEPFISNYLTGRTPSPCVLCNTFLKFDKLLDFARQVGIEKVATGHYARLENDSEEGFQLCRGRDPNKDQSYFLFELSQQQLAATLFPVGSYEKSTIRELARQHDLINASKPDSQEICFIPDRDYAGFIQRQAGRVDGKLGRLLQERNRPGPILFRDGSRLGRHDGIFRFTVGQRRGLGVAHRRPLYVLRVNPADNAIIVGYKEDLYSSGLLAERVNWISPHLPHGPFQAQVKIRSRHRAAEARITLKEEGGANRDSVSSMQARVEFLQPQMSVTPGQAAVFYQGERVLGGGWIREPVRLRPEHRDQRLTAVP